jgi:2-polyprenyl-3-methyl-5-hydroxy-6-metoxy-1,4-benzoquinol methylase
MAATLPGEERPHAGCGVCGSTRARELYKARDRLRNTAETFSIAKCEDCGVLRTLPELTESELARCYPGDYWGGDEPSDKWVQQSQAEKARILAKLELTAGRILDVGCGAGFFLRALESTRWDRYGIESDPRAAGVAASSLGTDHMLAGSLRTAVLPDSSFDVITMWSVLEHTTEPQVELAKARRLAKRGGVLVVQVPNAAGYQARLFRGNWFALDAPRHRHHFSPGILSRLIKRSGFDPFFITLRSREHNTHSLRQSLKSAFGADTSAVGYAAFLLTIPLLRPFDELMTLFGGGATITVAARAK